MGQPHPELNIDCPLEIHVRDVVQERLSKLVEAGWSLDGQAVTVAVYPHEPDGKPFVGIASSTRSVVAAAFEKVTRNEGPIDMTLDLASGELTLP